MDEAICPIPESWRSKVADLLREGKAGTVFIRQRARRDWASLTSCPFDSLLREVLAEALTEGRTPGRRHEMDEPGEAYGFIFTFRDLPIYAKVNLTVAGEVVIVYSAHRPLKGEEFP
jgi:hypothetical protein